MRCFADNKVCTCILDDIEECPRDPFRAGEGDDEFEHVADIAKEMDNAARTIRD